MTNSRRMLLETLAGHFAWLQEAHPRKANTQTVKRCKRMVLSTLRQNTPHRRMAA